MCRYSHIPSRASCIDCNLAGLDRSLSSAGDIVYILATITHSISRVTRGSTGISPYQPRDADHGPPYVVLPFVVALVIASRSWADIVLVLKLLRGKGAIRRPSHASSASKQGAHCAMTVFRRPEVYLSCGIDMAGDVRALRRCHTGEPRMAAPYGSSCAPKLDVHESESTRGRL